MLGHVTAWTRFLDDNGRLGARLVDRPAEVESGARRSVFPVARVDDLGARADLLEATASGQRAELSVEPWLRVMMARVLRLEMPLELDLCSVQRVRHFCELATLIADVAEPQLAHSLDLRLVRARLPFLQADRTVEHEKR